ncbi:MAG: response regulator [Verrucomicrobia bacterium]|nr:response regulator [Verrucomicrobiota bacterium]
MTNSAGEARSVLLTASDITEAKRLETQFLRAQRLDTLGSLAGGVAHDLNNVLTPIMMSVGMLRELAKAPHDIELVHLIDDSARRGANIIRQLLQFGRGSEGSSEQLHVALVANEIALIIQGTFPKNIVFSRELPADLWPVNADATQLHQVLLNLCVNARDAMPSGGHLALAACNRHIDAATAASQLGARPGPHVVIRVSDNGSGMSAAVIEKIFDPFFTTKPPGQGSGLGLPAVLNIVRRHRGFVTVKSEPGCGSEFAVHLPAALTAAEIQQPDLSTGVRRGAERLVLVVDDETAVRTLIERALEHAGYRALMASDGRSALALFADRADEIELVISDMMMPGMDGVTTIRHLRERRPDLPVLAISGVRTTSVALEELPPPRIGFLEKPFAIEAFLHAVYQAVESGHRAR